jgi:hypothetical protein
MVFPDVTGKLTRTLPISYNLRLTLFQIILVIITTRDLPPGVTKDVSVVTAIAQQANPNVNIDAIIE